MKTTIKIHDAQWFKAHCRISTIVHNDIRTCKFIELVPKYASWRHKSTIHWLHGTGSMSSLEGKVLQVELDSGIIEGAEMNNARYQVKGYWIPNWAIEWVEEHDD